MYANVIPIETMLAAYAEGIFPMASEEDNFEIFWYEPEERCIIPIHRFHASRSLLRLIRKRTFSITVNRAFERVIRACAEPRDDSPGCWLSEDLIRTYINLHRFGFANSVEVWQEDDLVGGLFGVSMGGLFAGESMFHRVTNASKVALWATNECLRTGGYRIFDVQLWTSHLAQFGAVNIPSSEYKRRLSRVINIQTEFSLPNELNY